MPRFVPPDIQLLVGDSSREFGGLDNRDVVELEHLGFKNVLFAVTDAYLPGGVVPGGKDRAVAEIERMVVSGGHHADVLEGNAFWFGLILVVAGP